MGKRMAVLFNEKNTQHKIFLKSPAQFENRASFHEKSSVAQRKKFSVVMLQLKRSYRLMQFKTDAKANRAWNDENCDAAKFP